MAATALIQYDYTRRSILQRPRAKEHYTYHYSMLLNNALSAVIYGKSMN